MLDRNRLISLNPPVKPKTPASWKSCPSYPWVTKWEQRDEGTRATATLSARWRHIAPGHDLEDMGYTFHSFFISNLQPQHPSSAQKGLLLHTFCIEAQGPQFPISERSLHTVWGPPLLAPRERQVGISCGHLSPDPELWEGPSQPPLHHVCPLPKYKTPHSSWLCRRLAHSPGEGKEQSPSIFR